MTAGVVIRGAMKPGYEKVLTPEAIDFAVELEREFGAERRRLLARRAEIQRRLDAGWKPDFLPETKAIRDGDWRVAPIPRDLQDRRVEITGPTDRKMVINALNCGANVFMADFEDANTPTWDNLIEGQANLSDAVRRTITFDDPADGPALRAERQDRRAVRAAARLASAGKARPRRRRADVGRAVRLRACSSSTTRRNWWRAAPGPTSTCRSWRAISKRGCGTTSSCTRRQGSGCPKGTIRATVLIETIMAAFEMDEILWELRDHSAGLNCGRWDYIYSFIKKFAEDPNCVMPDRGAGHDDQRISCAATACC